MRKRADIKISAELVDDANAICASLSPYAADTFTIGWSVNGKSPFTHYVASWDIDAEMLAALESLMDKKKEERNKKYKEDEEKKGKDGKEPKVVTVEITKKLRSGVDSSKLSEEKG